MLQGPGEAAKEAERVAKEEERLAREKEKEEARDLDRDETAVEAAAAAAVRVAHL